MIVDHDESARVQHQRPLDDFARINRDMVHGSDRKLLIRDDAIASVEVEDVESLDRAADGERAKSISACQLPMTGFWLR